MAAKNNRSQVKHLKSGGSYSSEELRFLSLDDGTRVVHSADGDIRRPICAAIDVHKEILMAAVCRTDTETLGATFYVRKFTAMNSDIRSMAIWLRGMAWRTSAWSRPGNTGSLYSTSWSRMA